MQERIIVSMDFTSTDQPTKGTNYYKGQILDGDLFTPEYEEILIHNEYVVRKYIMDLHSPAVFADINNEEPSSNTPTFLTPDQFTITEVDTQESPIIEVLHQSIAPISSGESIVDKVGYVLPEDKPEFYDETIKNLPTSEEILEAIVEADEIVQSKSMEQVMQDESTKEIDIQIAKDGHVDIQVKKYSDLEERIIGPLLITLVALAGAVASGYMTVMGYTSLFPNAGIVIISIIATLEIAKFSIASVVLHQKGLDLFHKSTLGAFAVVLVIMAAVGHYGYLSKAYGSSNSVVSTSKATVENIDQQLVQLQEDKKMLKSQLDGIPSDWISAKRRMFKTVMPKIDAVDAKISKLNDEKSSLIKSVSSKGYQDHNTMNESAKLLGMSVDTFANYVIATFAIIIDPLLLVLTSAAGKMRRHRRKS